MSSASSNSSARIDRLFIRLAAVYGHLWQSQFKDEGFLKYTKEVWEKTLRDVADKNIRLAINECSTKHEMPPTLPMFYKLCCGFSINQPVSEFEIKKRELIEAESECEHWRKVVSLAAHLRNQKVISDTEKLLKSAEEKHQAIKSQINIRENT